MPIRKITTLKENSTSRLSFRGGVQSDQSQRSRATSATRRLSAQEQQSAAYQVNVAYRKFFIEDDFNDITIEELAQFMERDDDFEEPAQEETQLEAQQQQESQQPPTPEAPPVNQRQVAAVDAYNWFATL